MSQQIKNIYRISFYNEETVFEIYARSISESEMYGFIVVEEFLFGEQSAIVVDPSEEKLKHEFSNVKRTYIPYNSIIRIDEVDKEGVPKVRETNGKANNVSQFPKGKVVTEK